eukprot:GILJ01007939.1.p1 GENE.GILJ01007939.1~~GILJ01007939.1.p1  ORF type:complete len:300 (-),score=10.23 GILJ01007939.1:133-1032(-)
MSLRRLVVYCSLSSFVLSSIFLSANGDANDCIFTAPDGSYYDLRPLIKTTGDYRVEEDLSSSGITISYKFYFNLCADTNYKCNNIDAPALEELQALKDLPATCSVQGSRRGMHFEALDNPAAGVKLVYGPGKRCHESTQPRQTTVRIECAEGVSEPQVSLHKIDSSRSGHQCDREFTLRSQEACPKLYISVGTYISIGVLAVVVIYLVVGILYKRRKGSSGIDLVPNLEFWKDLPALIKDGIMFSYNRLRGREYVGTGSSSSESVPILKPKSSVPKGFGLGISTPLPPPPIANGQRVQK